LSSRYNAAMKSCPSVALALAVWYLMLPPVGGGKLAERAPISQWQIAARFDSAADCAVKKAQFMSESEKLKADPGESVKLFARMESLAQCVDSDDPRLKGGQSNPGGTY